MGILHSLIDDITIGTNKTIARTVTGIPTDNVLNKAWFTVKDNYTRTDANAVFQLIVSTALTSDGQITDAGTSGTGAMQFLLTPTETLLLTPKKNYVFDIKVKLVDGSLYPAETGVVITDPRVTQANS